MVLPRSVRACALMLLPAVLSACAAQASPAPRGPDDTPPPASAQPAPQSATPSMADAVAPTVTTREMTDGILTDFYLPDRLAILRVAPTKGPAPLVVVVPGGGWQTSDPVDYRPLAEALTASGISTSLITYSTMSTGAQFPQPIDDVACAVRWSAFQLSALGYPPSQVILAGHSAGGQLAMEAALAGDRFGADCPMPPVKVDGVVGIAGVYDLSDPALVPSALFADGGNADERAQFSPIATAGDPGIAVPALKVMLLSGSQDVTVPAGQADQLATALRARGVDPTVDVLPLPHNMGFPLALEIAPIIKAWVLGETYVPPTSSYPPAAPQASVPPEASTQPEVPPADPAASPAG